MSLHLAGKLRTLGVSDEMLEILSNPIEGGLTITGDQCLNWIGPSSNISTVEARALIDEISAKKERKMTIEEYRRCVAAGVPRDEISGAPFVPPMEFHVMDASDIISSATVSRPSRDVTVYEFNPEELISPRTLNSGSTEYGN